MRLESLSGSEREHHTLSAVMSGFEVVGVVLGSIPVLIGALKHFQDGVSARSTHA